MMWNQVRLGPRSGIHSFFSSLSFEQLISNGLSGLKQQGLTSLVTLDVSA